MAGFRPLWPAFARYGRLSPVMAGLDPAICARFVVQE
jgi:hypothetical protein